MNTCIYCQHSKCTLRIIQVKDIRQQHTFQEAEQPACLVKQKLNEHQSQYAYLFGQLLAIPFLNQVNTKDHNYNWHTNANMTIPKLDWNQLKEHLWTTGRLRHHLSPCPILKTLRPTAASTGKSGECKFRSDTSEINESQRDESEASP